MRDTTTIGRPPVKVEEMNGMFPERPGEKTSLFSKIKFFILVIFRLPRLLANGPSKGALRAEEVRHLSSFRSSSRGTLEGE